MPDAAAEAPLTPVPEALQRADDWLKARRRFVLALLIAASALLRIVYWLEMRDTPGVHAHEWTQTDMAFSDEWARAIADGDWLSNGEYHPLMGWQKECATWWFAEFPEERRQYAANDEAAARALWNRWCGGKQFHQEPLYTYCVAVTYRVFGPDVRGVFAWQMLLGVASNVLIWILARRYFGDIAGAIAAAMALLYAPLLFYELALVRTTLTTFIGLSLVLIADRALEQATLRAWLLAGLAFGIALDCQTTFAVFILGAAVLLAIKHRHDRPTLLKFGGVMTAGMIVAMSPVVIRNIAVGAPTLGWASVGPWTFLSDNEASFDPDAGAGGLTPAQTRIMGRTDGHMPAIVVESLRSRGIGGWSWLLLQKFAKTWHWYEEPDNQNFYYYRFYSAVLANAPFTFFVISPLTLLGIGLVLGDPRRVAVPLVMVFSGVAVGMLAMPLSRYRVPFVAVMLAFAAFAVVRLIGWLLAGRWKPFAISVSCGALLAMWTSRPLPESHPLIRLADYGAPYSYFWAPRIAAARDTKEIVDVLEQSLRYEPPELKRLASGQASVSPAEAVLAKWYVNVYVLYGKKLVEAGRVEDGTRALQFAQRLDAIGSSVR